jgi:hypothetical protein
VAAIHFPTVLNPQEFLPPGISEDATVGRTGQGSECVVRPKNRQASVAPVGQHRPPKGRVELLMAGVLPFSNASFLVRSGI